MLHPPTLATALLAVSLSAQTVHVVGPGSFAPIQPAIAAAAKCDPAPPVGGAIR